MATANTSIDDKAHTSVDQRPNAYQVVTGPDTYDVVLDLEPIAISILSDLLQAMKNTDPSLLASLIAASSLKGMPRHDRLARIVERTRNHHPMQVVLRPDVADALYADLGLAVEEPPTCLCGAGYRDLEDSPSCSSCDWTMHPRIGA